MISACLKLLLLWVSMEVKALDIADVLCNRNDIQCDGRVILGINPPFTEINGIQYENQHGKYTLASV